MIGLADKLTPIALLLLLALGIVALGLTFASPARMRTASLVAISLVLAGEVWWIVFYAQGLDGYFPDGSTRWDFALKNGGRPWVVTAVAAASVSIVLLLLSTITRGRGVLAGISLVGASVSSFLLLVGWFVLTVGH
jgi:hypothetical protein